MTKNNSVSGAPDKLVEVPLCSVCGWGLTYAAHDKFHAIVISDAIEDDPGEDGEEWVSSIVPKFRSATKPAVLADALEEISALLLKAEDLIDQLVQASDSYDVTELQTTIHTVVYECQHAIDQEK